MMIIVSRSKTGSGLTLQGRKGEEIGLGEYEQTIQPGDSALGFTYEEWDTSVGLQEQRRFEVTEDGALHPMLDDDAE